METGTASIDALLLVGTSFALAGVAIQLTRYLVKLATRPVHDTETEGRTE